MVRTHLAMVLGVARSGSFRRAHHFLVNSTQPRCSSSHQAWENPLGPGWQMRKIRMLGMQHVGVSSSSWGYPNTWLVFVNGKIPLKWMMTGVPPFIRKPPCRAYGDEPVQKHTVDERNPQPKGWFTPV